MTPETNHDIPVQTISLQALGRNWTIYRPASLEDLWEQMTAPAAQNQPDLDEVFNDKNNPQRNLARLLTQAFEEDDRIPYWTEIWPAGIALAEWLGEQRKQIENRFCLDLGCGLGFTALVGAWLGAKVLAMDYEHQALYYAALNTRMQAKNKIVEQNTKLASEFELELTPKFAPTPAPTLAPTLAPASSPKLTPTWLTADWRRPCFKPGSLELIWAGDIMYEHRFITPVANFLEHSLAKNGLVWIAEPGRNIYPEFAKTMQNRGWQVYIAGRRQARLPESRAPLVNVQIWQLQRKF